jgi:hypothetical protein
MTLMPGAMLGGAAVAALRRSSGGDRNRGWLPRQQSPLWSRHCEPTRATSDTVPGLTAAEAPGTVAAGGGPVK